MKKEYNENEKEEESNREREKERETERERERERTKKMQWRLTYYIQRGKRKKTYHRRIQEIERQRLL